MILQSLVQLYDRLAADPTTSATLPLRGYSKQNIAFSVVIDLSGNLVAIRDEREREGKRLVARGELMPGGAKSPGSGLNPNLFWDQPTYMLGFCVHSAEDAAKDEAKRKKRGRAPREFASFRERQLAIEKELSCPEFSALCRFLESWDPAGADKHPSLQFLRAEKVTGFGAFRIAGGKWLHDTPAIKSWWGRQQTDGTAAAICLVSGEVASIARLHPSIKTFPNASAKLVAFQDPAYTSYGKDQSFNAPVSELAAFKYATALNWLLDGPRPQRLRIGDTTVVFWSEQRTEAESLLGYLLGGQPADTTAQDAALNQKLETFLNVLRQGGGHLADLGDDLQTPFFILGLAPNAARISVRFWYTSTLGELLQHLKRHRDDLAIIKEYPDSDRDFPPIWKLLKETARTSDDIPPLLGGALTRAILTGGPYPQGFATAVLRRIRIDAADGERRTHVPYLRAALLKAFLNRNHQKAMNEALDPNRPEPAYHLGRLFAVYETAQRHAHDWQLERTIRETLYSAASATPLGVFGRLERLFHHHTREKRFPAGSSISYADIAAEIAQNFRGSPVYPASLGLPDQALFSVGYYHQLHFFRSLSAAKRADSASAAKAALAATPAV